jgi:hypothetical protein
MPEANYFPRVYDVAVIQWFQFMVHVMLFPKLNRPSVGFVLFLFGWFTAQCCCGPAGLLLIVATAGSLHRWLSGCFIASVRLEGVG